mmetsp:Transcript_14545/g.24066  ORF Transcript_14545/g.24066 Transcript_14545/m.24066 type:complete len:512 (+) Transcript_14545:99-1634(+)|eukprot:CAMPEP_0184675942 /NCGR_PEP_ID=MMETSP0308-20130426/88080_1 /TAXON_ID=38269 /ORGANISM="Gloeochaete witrockiana, Strain SAG 46.84" /LENGTH=511 /DNA_ID=CAMNT_0027123737 /DNA_START=77 /DNA_END=1612 /DNA_ORIENTATION=-
MNLSFASPLFSSNNKCNELPGSLFVGTGRCHIYSKRTHRRTVVKESKHYRFDCIADKFLASFFREKVPRAIPNHRTASAEGLFLCGSSVVDITPDYDDNVYLAGWGRGRLSKGVNDRLYARAVAFQRGHVVCGMVSLDLYGLSEETMQHIRKAVKKLMDPRHLLVCCTNNHSGPDAIGLWSPRPWNLSPSHRDARDHFLAELPQRVYDALARALKEARPAEMTTTNVAIDPQGLVRNLKRPGLVDRHMPVLHVREFNGGPTIATVLELACTPSILDENNQMLSADFPHYVVSHIQDELGGVALYMTGAAVSVVPDIPLIPSFHCFGQAHEIGARIAYEVVTGLANSWRPYDAEPTVKIASTDVYVHTGNKQYVMPRKLYEGGYTKTDVSVWALGHLVLGTVPGRALPSLGLRIKNLLRFASPLAELSVPMLLGATNDMIGTLTTSVEYEAPGQIEERRLCPDARAGEVVQNTLHDLVLLLLSLHDETYSDCAYDEADELLSLANTTQALYY